MKKIAIFLSFFLGLSFFFVPQTLAADKQATDSSNTKIVEVKKGEVINHDFFAAGSDVNISGLVNGDVFAAGGNINVDGKINGDLIAGSGNIVVNGEVVGNMRVGGGTVTINGLVGRNVTVGGSNVFIDEKAQIKGSLLGFSSNIKVNGLVGKDVRIYANQANINSTVGGNVQGSMASLILDAKAKILGDLDYQAKTEAQIVQGAVVMGKTVYQPLANNSNNWANWKPAKMIPVFFGLYGLGLYFAFVSILMALVFGLIFLYFFSKRMENMAVIIRTRFWACLGWGLLMPIIFLFIIIFLAISLVGIPFIFIVLPLFGVLIYFAKIFTAFALGRRILGEKKAWGWVLALGLLIYFALGLIWGINGIAGCVFTTVGLGAFFLDQKSRRQPAKVIVNTSKK
ncbi:MAG: hypothetical protein NT052_01160 [Candidatus Shapirobacteria bacterium]|nr:hypothetical protein [Candidatus Shapirobacteria bacterium]